MSKQLLHRIEFASIVVAWGRHGGETRVRQVEDIVAASKAPRPVCLRKNKDGIPGHPLYIRLDTELIQWRETLSHGE